MRWLLFVVFAILVAVPARADDPPPPAKFSGPFAGLQTHYGFGGGGDWCMCTGAPFLADATGGDGGIVVGANAGWDVRFGALVLEGEVRASYAEVDFAEQCGAGWRCTAKLQWLGEAQLSAGVVFGNTLIGVGAGYAAGDVHASSEALAFGGAANTSIHDGRVFSARVEEAMSGGWRYALEYRYYDMSGTNDIAGMPVDIDWTTHIGGLRITYEVPRR